ncbi:ankyrin repeat-containing domain protein [Neurospora tetraspora]|uniref:Ankyrin repeat-containing domain protein n=1 Tax=Neurospora tetraspora TaxID=94610 RepID=A0AAE0J976_9PEZI|nr:ankyrin repeat-containing domain protein [Neurospora tetraspora]
MTRSWSFYNSGSGFSTANTGPGSQHNNNAAGPQYNYNYYGCRLTRTECLRSLSFSNIDARRQDIALVHPNTGHPGTGKSTLMKHIWRHCQRALQGRTVATYFFHARGESPPLVILIDALDECSDSQVRDVVKFLEQLSITCLRSEANVCICLSSRHYPHITMAKYQEFVVENRNGHDTDIATYVHDNLTKSNPDIEKEVLNKASGIFMWVVLVVAMLNKAYDEGKIEAMEQKLREVPKDLDELFLTILSEENPDKHETILMLQWRRITYSSKGLIEVPKAKGTVQFIHESSLDPALESNPIGQSHDRLKNCCVSFTQIHASMLNDRLRNKISMDRDHLDSQYPFLEYASLYWLDHAEAAEARNVSQTEFLRGIKEDHGVERLSLAHTWFCYDKALPWEKCGEYADLLFASVIHSYNSIAKILLEHRADISPQGWDYGPALQASAIKGSTEMSRLLIEYGADPNGWHGGYTPLQDATRYGYKESVRLLLEHGADVNAISPDGTALCLALHRDSFERCTVSEIKDLIKLLVEHGADVNVSYGEYASNALHDAALDGDEEIVRLLLEHGADVNARGGRYDTALQAAACAANMPLHYSRGGDPKWTDITKMLLDNGADVNAQGGEYGTALQAAASYPYYNYPIGDGGTEMRIIAQMLLDHGADVNAQGGKYGTALQAAISTGQKDIEILLRAYGATVQQSPQGRTVWEEV